MSSSVTMTLAKQAQPEVAKPPFENMVWIPGGTFLMGSDKHYPEEASAHEVTVDGFWMDRHTVTNEEFRKFVGAYGLAHRYFDVPSGLSLYRAGEQVAVSVLEYLVRKNGEEFASRKACPERHRRDARDAKFKKK